jgi:hypothetical protein
MLLAALLVLANQLGRFALLPIVNRDKLLTLLIGTSFALIELYNSISKLPNY